MACQATRRQHSALPGSPRHRPAPPPLRGADGSWRRDNGACHQAISRRFTRTAHHGCSRTTPRGPRAPGIPRPRRPFPGGGDGPARAGDPYGAGEPGAGEPGAPGAALTRARGHGPAPPAEPARAARPSHGSGRAAENRSSIAVHHRCSRHPLRHPGRRAVRDQETAREPWGARVVHDARGDGQRAQDVKARRVRLVRSHQDTVGIIGARPGSAAPDCPRCRRAPPDRVGSTLPG